MDKINQEFAASILLQDPETQEELRPVGDPKAVDGSLVLIVENKGGDRRWKHTIRTEEV